MFHYTKEVSISVKEAVEAVETALKDESFGVLWNLDLVQNCRIRAMISMKR
jgi:uncharacterized protein (DUF302 family)